MSKSLGEKIFDAVFSGFICIDWHIDSWSGGWGVERLEQGIVVGIKEDGKDAIDIIWVGHGDSKDMKCQLRVEARLDGSLGKSKYGDEVKIMTLKSNWLPLPENGKIEDRIRVRSIIGQKILDLCRSYGNIELDLGMRGDIFFKAQSLEELMLKVDLLGEDASNDGEGSKLLEEISIL